MLLDVFAESPEKVRELMAQTIPDAEIVKETGRGFRVNCRVFQTPAIIRGIIAGIPGVSGVVWLE